MTRKAFAIAAALLCGWLVSFGAHAQETLRLLMPEPHGTTFRALYTAVEKGWFKDENIKIDFLPIPGGAINTVAQIAQGGGDIAWAGGYTIIQARARGVPIVGIQSASAESLWNLISHKDANIQKPQDLKGKTLGVLAFSSATHFMMQALLRSAGLQDSDVTLRPIGISGPTLLAQKQIDAYIWFRTQGLALQARGVPVNLMQMDNFMALPQDMILASEPVLKAKPKLFEAYLRVLKKADEYGRNPANDLEIDGYQAKYAPQTVQDVQYLRIFSKETQDRAKRDAAKNYQWGTTDPKVLAAAQETLFQLKVIDKKTPVEQMYTNALLPK
jgi:NitT/TauT family transport system substrate-binding protein